MKHNDNLTHNKWQRHGQSVQLLKTAHKVFLSLTLYVLFNKMQFTEEQLNKFIDCFEDLFDAYNKDYVSLDDVLTDLKETTGIEIK